MNIKDDFILSQINEGYLVGGSVRDAFMGKQESIPKDEDEAPKIRKYEDLFS